jgi:hypothetical protein
MMESFRIILSENRKSTFRDDALATLAVPHEGEGEEQGRQRQQG